MNFDLPLLLIELDIAQYGNATIILDHQPPEQVQSIDVAINSGDTLQDDDKPISLDALVPDINYCTMSPSINDLVAELVPNPHF
jgi:hypothetical protein